MREAILAKTTFLQIIFDMPFGRLRWLGSLAIIFWLTGCEYAQPLPTLTDAPTVTYTPVPLPTSPETSGDWKPFQPGLERRIIKVMLDGQHLESLYILRLDPDYYRFGVAYDPQGLTLDDWQDQTGALIVVNGGYFWQEGEKYYPNGLTVIDGIPMGDSYGDFGGMFAVSEAGPELRWLALQPYDSTESLLAAMQSFPILVKPGGELGFSAEHEDHISARRTVIAKDQEGHFLLMVAPQGNLTLHQLSAYLTASDLNLDVAVNLDGGPSSGILLANPIEKIPAISPLPIVITVHIR